mmetsp:Transcript_40410/g.126085  ORF Transcript_40410/g.126085 Transcript_40410/m.126085 type:complete len:222 (+) Transcript_40410:430-1095(+)
MGRLVDVGPEPQGSADAHLAPRVAARSRAGAGRVPGARGAHEHLAGHGHDPRLRGRSRPGCLDGAHPPGQSRRPVRACPCAHSRLEGPERPRGQVRNGGTWSHGPGQGGAAQGERGAQGGEREGRGVARAAGPARGGGRGRGRREGQEGRSQEDPGGVLPLDAPDVLDDAQPPGVRGREVDAPGLLGRDVLRRRGGGGGGKGGRGRGAGGGLRGRAVLGTS